MRANYVETRPYRTKDGTLIRELMHPAVHGNRNQSLAEAVVAPGQANALHRHGQSEELYHIAAGIGEMTLGEARFPVGVGDTVCIPPGSPHGIRNTGEEPLRICARARRPIPTTIRSCFEPRIAPVQKHSPLAPSGGEG